MSHLFPSRGKSGKILDFEVERHLTHDDIMRLVLEGKKQRGSVPVLQRLKATHLMAARLIAQGMSATEVALAVGRTPQRIRDLCSDPTFMNEVAIYQNQIASAGIDETIEMQGVLKDVGRTALEELQDRMDNPGKLALIPESELRHIAALALDRTIAPPKTAQPIISTPTHITFNMGNRDIRPQESKVIENEPELKELVAESPD